MRDTNHIFLVVGVAAIMVASGLIGYWAAPGQGEDHVHDGYYQVSTFARLNAGCYGGGVTIERLLENGDFGIGTVEGIDGEMMVIDGIAYRAGMDLSPVGVPSGTMIPFAMLTHFNRELTYAVPDIEDYAELKDLLAGLVTDGHIGYAVMIEAEFESVTIRSVPGQEIPYPPLADVIANQTTMALQNVRGTMIGFIMSDDLGDINIPGFHLHFLSDDLSYGGHVLDMAFNDAEVCVDSMSSITVTYTVS